VKLATWNVNSLKVRLPRVLEFLAEHEPDVICLQETKCEAEAFPVDELAQAGYHAVHHSAGRWAGVAVVARAGLQLADPVIGLPGELRDDEARRIEATVDFNVAPADLDVYDPAAFAGSTHVTPEERSRVEQILAAGHLVDAYRRLHPDEVQHTWWDYPAGALPPRDGAAHRPPARQRGARGSLIACGIARNHRKGSKPSDHAPLLLELEASP
jgi:exodeoxyribonuclease-3